MNRIDSLIRATSIGGCNIIAFDGVEFAREVAGQAMALSRSSPELAREYVRAMGNVTIKIENSTAHKEHHNHR